MTVQNTTFAKLPVGAIFTPPAPLNFLVFIKLGTRTYSIAPPNPAGQGQIIGGYPLPDHNGNFIVPQGYVNTLPDTRVAVVVPNPSVVWHEENGHSW